jgi:N-acyl-D-aspartate/D-glutamate deacylase
MKVPRIPLFGILLTLPFALLAVLSACSSSDHLPPEDASYDVAIVNGRVMDPMTGRDETATVAISNGKITLVSSGSGDESEIPARSARVIDARGLVVSPGFINTHTHEGDIQESMKVYVKDGITTWIGGNCGSSPGYPIRAYFEDLERDGLYNNFAALTGLNSLRSEVGLAYKDGATEPQIVEMVAMLADDMAAGSLGVSFGSYYHPGCTYEEMLATAEEAAVHGGMAASHIRDNLFHIVGKFILNTQVLDEAIETARQAGLPYIVSHITDISYGINATQLMLDKISAAIHDEGLPMAADVIGVNSFPNDFFTIARYGTIPIGLLMGVAGVEPTDFQVTEDVYISGDLFLEAYDSPQTVQQAQFLMGAILAGEAESPGVLCHIIRPENTMLALSRPFVFVGNDGYVNKDPITGELLGHPRAAGAFARFIGHWARDMGIMDLMQALYKATAAPAIWFGLADKGRLGEGRDADIVIFDPDRIIDTAICAPGNTDPATFLNPPDGIQYVIVNGKVVVENGTLTGEKSGRVIRRTWTVPGTALDAR